MTAYPEIDSVLARARKLMANHGVGALWARDVATVAWLTQGVDVAVNTASSYGVASVLVTPQDAYVLTNTIEAPRLRAEDKLGDKGFKVQMEPWWSADYLSVIHDIVPAGERIGSDAPVSPEMLDLSAAVVLERARLSAAEQSSARETASRCADAMNVAIRAVQPGMTDFEIAALLDRETRARGVTPIVNLIGVDERIFKVRHPMPIGATMEKYAMLVLCGRRQGIVISVTRLVHFGPLPSEVRRKMEACARVDAAAVAATRPGATQGEVFDIIRQAYADTGYPDEWQLHHQGGLAGYSARECVAGPGDETRVEAGQIFAWNPSISGVKVEDTILITPDGADVITAIDDWPTVPVEAGGRVIPRPVILEK